MSCSVHSRQLSGSSENSARISFLARSVLRLPWNHQAYRVSSIFRVRVISALPVSQAVSFPHGDLSVNQYLVGIVDDPVQDGLGNGTALLGIGVEPLVPITRLVLGAEDHGTLAAPGQSTSMASPGLCWMRMVVFVTLAHWRYFSQNWVYMYGTEPSSWHLAQYSSQSRVKFTPFRASSAWMYG